MRAALELSRKEGSSHFHETLDETMKLMIGLYSKILVMFLRFFFKFGPFENLGVFSKSYSSSKFLKQNKTLITIYTLQNLDLTKQKYTGLRLQCFKRKKE